MPAPPPNLYKVASRGSAISRMSDIVIFAQGNNGAFVAPAMDFVVAQRWAQGRPTTGVVHNDRALFFGKMPTILVRRGTSFIQNRGDSKSIGALVTAMKAAGVDLGEWSIPKEPPSKKKPGAADDEIDAPAPTHSEKLPGIPTPRASTVGEPKTVVNLGSWRRQRKS